MAPYIAFAACWSVPSPMPCFSNLFWVAFIIYVYLLYGDRTHMSMPIVQCVCTWRAEDSWQELVFFFSHVVPGNWTQIVSHLADTNLTSFTETKLLCMLFCGLVWNLMVRLKVTLLKCFVDRNSLACLSETCVDILVTVPHNGGTEGQSGLLNLACAFWPW